MWHKERWEFCDKSFCDWYAAELQAMVPYLHRLRPPSGPYRRTCCGWRTACRSSRASTALPGFAALGLWESGTKLPGSDWPTASGKKSGGNPAQGTSALPPPPKQGSNVQPEVQVFPGAVEGNPGL